MNARMAVAGAQVDEGGCELDSDGDGIVDSADQCPQTVAGVQVAETGCN
ncbi:MAG: thrombospondin type 3 repeat-containing protein [Thiolinea sp.]